MTQLQVRLYRDSFTTPWGFRLQGGRDIGPPLTIQRVFSNSPAEGELQRGDRVLSLGGRPGSELTNQQAQDIVRRPTGQIDVVVHRPVPSRVSSTATFTPAAQRPRAQSVQPAPRIWQPSQARSIIPQSQYGGYGDYSYPSRDYSNPYQLGGQNFDFGTDYHTLPRTRPRGTSQPPVQRSAAMPVSRSGFTPKKVTLSRLGGGGPEFGSDFTRYRPSSVMQPVHVHQGPSADTLMMSRMQDTMDNLSLSPRQQEFGYQAPPFAGGSQYIPTGVRLDMEREQELRQQQMQQQQQSPQYQPQQQDYQPSQPVQQQIYFEPKQPYVPTGVRLDHQMARTGKNTAPRVLRPKPGSSGFSFGVDYSKPQPKTSSVTWKPQPAQRPVNAAPAQPEVFQPSPAQWSPQMQQMDEPDEPSAPPAWRNTLRTTGVKPWDKDLDYTAGQQAAPVRSQVQNPDKGGDRDWTQSAVYRMIYEEEKRGRGGPPPQQQQQQQQQKPPPPAPAPKPQVQSFQQAFNPMDGDFGTSDF